MIKKRKKYLDTTNYDQFQFTADDGTTLLADDSADVVIETNLTGTLLGSTDYVGDIFLIDNSNNLKVYGLDGGDIFIFSTVSGTINAGPGGDIIIADTFSGIIDLGADEDGDILILTNSPDVIIRNYNPELDTVIRDDILA